MDTGPLPARALLRVVQGSARLVAARVGCGMRSIAGATGWTSTLVEHAPATLLAGVAAGLHAILLLPDQSSRGWDRTGR